MIFSSTQSLLGQLSPEEYRAGFMAVNVTALSLGQASGPILAGTMFTKMKEKSNQGHIEKNGSLSDVLVSQEVGDKNTPSKAHIRKGIVGDWKNYLSDSELNFSRNYVQIKKETCPHVIDFFSLEDLLC